MDERQGPGAGPPAVDVIARDLLDAIEMADNDLRGCDLPVMIDREWARQLATWIIEHTASP
jgi:hypothetical protein